MSSPFGSQHSKVSHLARTSGAHYEHNFGSAYSRNLPSLGETIVQILQFFGCRRLYGVGGDFAANIIAALDKNLIVAPSSNEMHAGFSACAQAEIEGMGFCLSTYTVGSLPCISAAALAKAERLPVIFISGAPGESEVAQGNADSSVHASLHHTVHSAFHWCEDYDAALRAFACLGLRAERLQGDRSPGQPNVAGLRFMELLTHAFTHREPVFIEIPRDLIAQKTQSLRLPYSTDELLKMPFGLSGAEAIAQSIAFKLRQAQSPLVYIGEQIKLNAYLCEQLMVFCHALHIPYATTWFAKGLFDEYDPLCLGCYNGVFSNDSLRHYIKHEVDYVLDIGTSIFAQDTAQAFHTNTHLIASFSNKTLVKSTLAHEADLVSLLDDLLAQEYPERRFNPPPIIAPLQSDEARLDFHNLADTLNELQGEDQRPFVYLPEVGNSYFASYGLRTRHSELGRSWIANPWYAAMGTSLPYARVVAENIRDRKLEERAVVLTGDGGFHFQLNELIHFQKEQLAVTIVYMRNNIFHLGQCGNSTIYHCSDTQFDVQTLVKAYGGEAYLCTTVGEFKQAFLQALRHSGITLLEIPCIVSEEFQCREIRWLNLYIQARNGVGNAAEEWEKLCQA